MPSRQMYPTRFIGGTVIGALDKGKHDDGKRVRNTNCPFLIFVYPSQYTALMRFNCVLNEKVL
jgi:hypothetical protein